MLSLISNIIKLILFTSLSTKIYLKQSIISKLQKCVAPIHLFLPSFLPSLLASFLPSFLPYVERFISSFPSFLTFLFIYSFINSNFPWFLDSLTCKLQTKLSSLPLIRFRFYSTLSLLFLSHFYLSFNCFSPRPLSSIISSFSSFSSFSSSFNHHPLLLLYLFRLIYFLRFEIFILSNHIICI